MPLTIKKLFILIFQIYYIYNELIFKLQNKQKKNFIILITLFTQTVKIIKITQKKKRNEMVFLFELPLYKLLSTKILKK